MTMELPETYIALLRGINVGGKNKLPMSELAHVFDSAGYHDVKTYIQSGNVVFKAQPGIANDFPAIVSQSILQHAGLRVPVVVRTRDELAAVIENNPFIASGLDPTTLHVMFLAETPGAQAIGALDPGRSPPDSFVVIGSEVYLHCPGGFARTKLTNDYFDSKLRTISTCRNWRTTLKLLELADG